MAADLVTASIGPFLIVFREALEAGLVTAIIFAYLKKINRQDLYRWGYLGIALSIVASFGLGYLLYVVYSGLTETFARIFEISAGTGAVTVLSYMIVWMTSNARKIKGKVEERIDVAVTTGNLVAISTAAFTSVGREGLETVLFLAPFIGNNLTGVLVGGLLGVVCVVVLLYLLARRIYQARLSSVFKYTSLLVAVLAAGILYHAMHELVELLGDSGITLGFLSRQAYNLGIPETSLFGEEGLVGGIIHSFTGYMQSAPWLSVISYLVYWAMMGSLLYKTYQSSPAEK
ncbi:MAG: FTR1 family protein [archaeon]